MTGTPSWVERRATAVSIAGYTLVWIWPGARFLAGNAGELELTGWALPLLVVAAVSALLWLAGFILAFTPILFFRSWSVPRAVSAGTIGVIVLFSHEGVRAWLLASFPISATSAAAIYLGFLGGSLVLTWFVARREQVRVALVIAAAFLAMHPLGQAVRTAYMSPGLLMEGAAGPRSDPSADPPLTGDNIYFVILDGYVGQAVLRQDLDYDIEPFLREMTRLGYAHIGAARANYTTTYLSLMGTLEMNYIVTEDTPRYTDRRRFYPYKIQHGNSPYVIERLFRAGYDVFHVGNAIVPCRPHIETRCLRSATRYGFYEHLASVFLTPTKLDRLLWPVSGRDRTSFDAITPLGDAVENLMTDHQPFFVLAHHMSPHPPYRHADCSMYSRTVSEPAEQRAAYTSSIECVNRIVLSLARRLQAEDPGAIIVFQADHGSEFRVDWKIPLREWPDGAIDERSSVFSLVRVPPRCREWLRPDLSPINTMRLVLGCVERRRPNYLEERTFLSAYEQQPDFGAVIDVTARLPARRLH